MSYFNIVFYCFAVCKVYILDPRFYSLDLRTSDYFSIRARTRVLLILAVVTGQS